MKILETNSQEHIAREREREKRERYGGGTRAPKRVHTFKSNRGEGAEKRAGVLFVFIEREAFFLRKRRPTSLLKRQSKSIALRHTHVSSRAVSLFVALTLKKSCAFDEWAISWRRPRRLSRPRVSSLVQCQRRLDSRRRLQHRKVFTNSVGIKSSRRNARNTSNFATNLERWGKS